MAITTKTENITVNKTYVEKIEERTRSIRIEVPVGQEPLILVTRELATYHDDVLVSTQVSKKLKITLSDLQAINKLGLMTDIADAIDQISLTK